MLMFECQPHSSNKAISSIYNEFLKGEDQLTLRPTYQRGLVWTDEQKGNLISSIMLVCPIPIFLLYTYKHTNECIDGQNRLSSIKEYIEQTDTSNPWAWVIEHEDDDYTEYVFYRNPSTEAAMTAYCLSKTRAKKGRSARKDYRLMTPEEVKRFNGYLCVIAQINTKLEFDQRKEIFLRWQSGTIISQCDRFKNEGHPFCNFVIEQGLENSLSPLISKLLKSGRKNWLFDMYRMINIFREGMNDPSQVLLSTIRTRSKITSDKDFTTEQMKDAVKGCEKFLAKFEFLSKAKDMYISFILQIAFLWVSFQGNPEIREVMEKEQFLLKFAEESLDNDAMNHSTLNNGPHEKQLISVFPAFKDAFMAAYSSQRPPSPQAQAPLSKKKNLPGPRKTEVWNAYVGVDIGKTKCLCCGISDITARDFEGGHVIPECDGGTIDVSNLRPICGTCNRSMGSTNMIAWMKRMYPTRVLKGTV